MKQKTVTHIAKTPSVKWKINFGFAGFYHTKYVWLRWLSVVSRITLVEMCLNHCAYV